MTDTKALIAEARDEAWYEDNHGGDRVMARLLRDLADALEKATSTPPEPPTAAPSRVRTSAIRRGRP